MAAIPIQPLELLVSEGEKGASSESQLSIKRPQYRKRTRPTLLQDVICFSSLTCYCYELLKELCKSSLALILVPLIVSLATVVARNVGSHLSRKQSTWMRRASSLALLVMMSLSMNNAASIFLFGHLDFNMTVLSVVLFAGGCAVRFSSTAVVCDEPIGDSKPPEVGDQAGRSCVASQGSRERDISAPGSTSDDPAYLSFQQVVPEQRQRQVPADSIGSRAAEKSLISCRVEAGPGAMEPSVAEWVLDSGAGFHTTGNLRNLQLLQDDRNLITYDLQSADALRAADGERLHILACGSVKTDRIEVPNVRYIQGLKMNIISVLQLAREHSLEVTFEPRYCYIRKSGGQIVGRGARSRNGVYVLEYLRIRLEDDASSSMPTGTRDADDDDGSQPQAGPDPHSCVGSDMVAYRVGVNKSLCSSWDDSELPSIHRAFNVLAQHAGGAGSEMLGLSSGDTMSGHDEDPVPMEYEYTMSSPTAASGHCPHPPLAAPAFLIDSGASSHVTGNKELFTDQGPSEIKEIYLADGRPRSVLGVGFVTSGGINLPRVLLGEDMTRHILVSVSQLTRDHNVKVVFEREYVTIKELGSERTVGQGYVKDGMYHVDRLSLPGVTNPAS